MKLYRIGQLSKLSNLSQRTIDYYTKLGLIEPEKRSDTNYRYYSDETLVRLKRIESLKKEKYTLEEIKNSLKELDRVGHDDLVTNKLADLQARMRQLEKEAKELGPMIEQLKPKQLKYVSKILTPQSAACIEAILLLLGKGPLL
ncbi:MerR family transcriptional regulator [Paenibacillus aurantius]|uniref:MerR family transcriptional regulator n=1 Tax=Paenibacillus aurantius TaxID=2918900 RepID=A0AA96LHM1_9BACL|nr:MerR family transcriptional regulator [Paenibacillus aurantius]WJH37577.1 MerR family transcriptional regulator [Paenibacillus sp. CC-CFT747]WNQ14289.1 MerR family transcriptional regulator [Paenibacillus aurantius]